MACNPSQKLSRSRPAAGRDASCEGLFYLLAESLQLYFGKDAQKVAQNDALVASRSFSGDKQEAEGDVRSQCA